MLRRLFLSHVTIESFSSDPQYRVRPRNESTNRREEVCPKMAKTSPIDVSLAYSIAESYGLGGFRSASEGFSGKNLIPTCSLDAERRS
jgi:hypothetical protein